MPSPNHRTPPPAAILGVGAFLAILPLLLHGPSCGHDFDFHLLSWLEAANQFAHFGYPHWAFTPAWNAGEPRFLFYPPLSWTLGAVLGLILPWNSVPIAFTWVALFLSGLTMHRLASRYASPAAATIAATVYLANPYMLFTAYERTAYGELLAAAWLPLLFAAAFAERVRILPIAGAIALLWLTNAPAAVMGSYALAFLTLIRLIRRSKPDTLPPAPSHLRLRLGITTICATALGLAFAAFYIVPAAYEQRFVQVNMAVIPGMRVSDHFLFHRMGGQTFDDLFHDVVVRTASEVALTLLAAITVALLVAWRKRSSLPSSLFPLPSITLLTLLIAFLLTPPSLILWNHIPKLAFLQFPWRLNAILGVILALATAIALKHLRQSLPSSLFPLPLSLLLILPAYHLFAQRCDREDSVPARVALFHSNLGTEPTDEYTPVGADNDLLSQQTDPPYWLVPSSPSDDAPPPPKASAGQSPAHLALDLPAPEYLVLNRRQYPHWRTLLNGSQPTPLHRKDGLLVVLLPRGHSTIDLVWVTNPDQIIGLIISGIALLIAILIPRQRPIQALDACPRVLSSVHSLCRIKPIRGSPEHA
jgi:hypothetical protein